MSQDFYCDSVLSKKLPVQVVKETDTVLAFFHTMPTWEFHVAIIPKQHVATLVDADIELLKEIMDVIRTIIIENDLHKKNFKIITNGGDYQSTNHLHFHLVSGSPLNTENPAQSGEMRV